MYFCCRYCERKVLLKKKFKTLDFYLIIFKKDFLTSKEACQFFKKTRGWHIGLESLWNVLCVFCILYWASYMYLWAQDICSCEG